MAGIVADNNTAIEHGLGQAAIYLAGKGFLAPGDTLSQRIPERDAFVLVEVPRPEAVMDFRWTGLCGSPVGLHHRVYAARPDVGAIAAGAFPWTGTLASLDLALPAVFDEQVRHLGVEVVRVATRSTDGPPIPVLSNGANAFALDDLSLCFGMGMERLMANIEILEKCAESFVLARSASSDIKPIPWLVKFIANGRLKKDQKDAAARHLRGERAIMKAGY